MRSGSSSLRFPPCSMWSRRSARQALMLAGALALTSCKSRGGDTSAAGSTEGQDQWRNWGMVEAEVYFSALDTLLAKRFPSETRYVADSVYWWPLAARHPNVPLEAAPPALRAVGRAGGRTISYVAFNQAVAEDGSRLVQGPVVLLGPIDMLGEDHALFRVNLYLGLNGQELNRVRARRIAGRWKVVEIAPEVAT